MFKDKKEKDIALTVIDLIRESKTNYPKKNFREIYEYVANKIKEKGCKWRGFFDTFKVHHVLGRLYNGGIIDVNMLHYEEKGIGMVMTEDGKRLLGYSKEKN